MTLKVLLVVALLMSAALAAIPKPHELEGYSFEQYVKDFGKSYDGKEYFRRKVLFLRNLASIAKHNRDASSSYVMGVNHMSDWTEEEFSRLNGGKIHSMKNLADKTLQKKYKSSNAPLPAQVDYRGHVPSVLTAVKDQGQCGSCWAHAATETMETHNALVTGKLFVMSTQQVTSCTPNTNHCGGTGGCSGATADLAYESVINNGIGTEWQDPYTAYYGNTGDCLRRGSVASASDYVKVTTNDQDAVLDALAHVGPLAVNVDASNWHSYSAGIFDGCDFSKNIDINHVVQLVGYGRDAGLGKDYWIIRNSWGPNWGENGYMRMLKTDSAQCGTDSSMQDGTACDGEPSTAKVCGMCGMLYDASYPIMSK